jgi:hypothetical protein
MRDTQIMVKIPMMVTQMYIGQMKRMMRSLPPGEGGEGPVWSNNPFGDGIDVTSLDQGIFSLLVQRESRLICLIIHQSWIISNFI